MCYPDGEKIPVPSVTFKKMPNAGLWVAMMGDDCGCNQRMVSLPITDDGEIGGASNMRDLANDWPDLYADAELLATGP